jgi:hypothetical protein
MFAKPLLPWKSSKYYTFRVSVALVIQHVKHMCYIMLSSVACMAPSYFSTLSSHKPHDLRKTLIEHKMCVLIFSTTFVWNISHSKKKSGRYYHKCTQMFMYSIHYSCLTYETWIFWRIFKKYSNIKFRKKWDPSHSRLVDGQRDRHHKANSRFFFFFEHT